MYVGATVLSLVGKGVHDEHWVVPHCKPLIHFFLTYVSFHSPIVYSFQVFYCCLFSLGFVLWGIYMPFKESFPRGESGREGKLTSVFSAPF